MSGSAASLARAPHVGLPVRLLSDDRLVRMAAEGSSRAFAQLHERHAGPLYRYCRSIVRHDQDAQDVLQTTMARALAALAKGPPDAPLRPWLFRIAHNEAISLLRARRDTTELDDAASLAAPSVEGQAEQRERLGQLVADLADLPERQRAALVMRELSGLSHAEIAAALGVSLSGAKQAIFEARVGLGEFAKGRDMDCADVQRMISDADGRTLRGRPMRAHLRQCTSCRALRDAIAPRQNDLAALAPPLPAAVSAAVLAKLAGGSGTGGSGAGGTGIAAAAGGKAATAAMGTKLALGAAVLATATAAAPAIVARVEAHRPAAASGGSAQAAGGAAAGGAAASGGARRSATGLETPRGDRPATAGQGARQAAHRGSPPATPSRSSTRHGGSAASHGHRKHAKPPHSQPKRHGHSHRPAAPPGQARIKPVHVHPAKPIRPAKPVKAPAAPVKAAPVKAAPAKPQPVKPAAPAAPTVTHVAKPKPAAPAPVATAPAAPPAPAASTPPGQAKKSGK